MRTTKNVSITVPPSLLKDAKQVAKRESTTQSELFREALRRYVIQSQFRALQEYGIKQSKKLGLKPSDVPRLIQEVRDASRRKYGKK